MESKQSHPGNASKQKLSKYNSLDVYTNREQISRDDTDDDVAVEEDTSNSFKGYTFVRKKHTPS